LDERGFFFFLSRNPQISLDNSLFFSISEKNNKGLFIFFFENTKETFCKKEKKALPRSSCKRIKKQRREHRGKDIHISFSHISPLIFSFLARAEQNF